MKATTGGTIEKLLEKEIGLELQNKWLRESPLDSKTAVAIGRMWVAQNIPIWQSVSTMMNPMESGTAVSA